LTASARCCGGRNEDLFTPLANPPLLQGQTIVLAMRVTRDGRAVVANDIALRDLPDHIRKERAMDDGEPWPKAIHLSLGFNQYFRGEDASSLCDVVDAACAAKGCAGLVVDLRANKLQGSAARDLMCGLARRAFGDCCIWGPTPGK
jgi:hypothetical protein